MNRRIQNMILAALMLALSWLMPFLALLNPAIAQVISPMHIPIFLCGFLCDLPGGAGRLHRAAAALGHERHARPLPHRARDVV